MIYIEQDRATYVNIVRVSGTILFYHRIPIRALYICIFGRQTMLMDAALVTGMCQWSTLSWW